MNKPDISIYKIEKKSFRTQIQNLIEKIDSTNRKKFNKQNSQNRFIIHNLILSVSI